MIEGSCDCGAVTWRFEDVPERATACSCTLCRRYGALWAYDYENQRIAVSGETSVHVRGDRWIGFHFCSKCGCIAYWRALEAQDDGRRRMAVNLRLAEPEAVAAITIRRFDGLTTYEDAPSQGRRVGDYWF